MVGIIAMKNDVNATAECEGIRLSEMVTGII